MLGSPPTTRVQHEQLRLGSTPGAKWRCLKGAARTMALTRVSATHAEHGRLSSMNAYLQILLNLGLLSDSIVRLFL